jgi:PHS family inorganic phosphate transporter-like MFS transporter
MMAAVFAMQGFGQFTAGLIALIVTAGFKESLKTASDYSTCSGVCQLAADKMWRVVIGFGAVPGCIALYYRLTIPETPRYTFDVGRDVEKAGADINAYIAGKAEGTVDEITRVRALQEAQQEMEIPKASWKDFFHHYSKWQYAKVLIGTAGSWFLLDVAFYGLGLNIPLILSEIGYAGGNNVYEKFYNTAVGNLILVCAGAIPGYWFSVAFVDTLGRKPIQIGGFSILTLLFCIIGFGFYAVGKKGIFALYIISEFFLNFGTQYSPPSRFQPTNIRNQDRTLPPLSFPVNAFQHDTVALHMVLVQLPARSEPSLLKSSSGLWQLAAILQRTIQTPGSTMSWKSSLSLCSWEFSLVYSFQRPNGKHWNN